MKKIKDNIKLSIGIEEIKRFEKLVAGHRKILEAIGRL